MIRQRIRGWSAGRKASAIFFLLGTVSLVATTQFLHGWKAAVGVIVAAATCCFSLIALSIVIRSFLVYLPSTASGVKKTLSAGLLKMPVAVLGLWLAFSLSPDALAEVFGEIVLVYSCFVWFLACSSDVEDHASL